MKVKDIFIGYEITEDTIEYLRKKFEIDGLIDFTLLRMKIVLDLINKLPEISSKDSFHVSGDLYDLVGSEIKRIPGDETKETYLGLMLYLISSQPNIKPFKSYPEDPRKEILVDFWTDYFQIFSDYQNIETFFKKPYNEKFEIIIEYKTLPDKEILKSIFPNSTISYDYQEWMHDKDFKVIIKLINNNMT